MRCLQFNEAQNSFSKLPPSRSISTLSPGYLIADASRAPELEPLFLEYRETEKFWLHGVLRGKIPEIDCCDLQSPYGYGGPVSNSNDDDFLKRAWDDYCRWCKDSRILVDFVRLHPLALAWQPYYGTLRDDRKTVAVALDVDDISDNYSARCKRALQKARRANMTIGHVRADAETILKFATFYRAGMEALDVADFYFFSDEYFLKIQKNIDARLVTASIGAEWVSAALILIGAEVAEYHLGASLAQGKAVSASSLVHHEAASHAKAAGLKFYYLGGGTDGSPENPLYVFKKGFSNHHPMFKWGFHKHMPEEYDSMSARYAKAGKPNSRVLFYRTP